MGDEFPDDRFTAYGWDRRALLYPTGKSESLLVLGFVVLLVFHFSEILGFADSKYLLMGFFPAHFAYHIVHAILALVFVYMVYRRWPENLGGESRSRQA